MHLLSILCLLLAAGQEIRLDGPTEPLQPREYCQILVHGLSDAELPTAEISWSPREGTTLLPARLWGGQPFLLFSGKTPGRVTITVTTHAWRGNLDAAVDAVRRAGTIDADLWTRLVTLQQELAGRYPLRSGTCDVEVAGVPPPPPPGPDPGPAETTGTAYLLIFRHADQVSADQAAVLAKLRTWTDSLGDHVSHLEFSPDAGSEDARVASYAAKIPAGSPLPWCFLARGRSDGQGTAILWAGPLPATAAELQTIYEKLVR